MMSKIISSHTSNMDNLTVSLYAIQEDIKEERSFFINKVSATSASVENRINETKQSLSELERHLNKFYITGETDRGHIKSIIGKISKSCLDLNQQAGNYIGSLDNSIKENFAHLNLDLHNSSKDAISAVQRLVNETNIELIEEVVQSAVDRLRPKGCWKGMAYAPAQAPFPYPVIYPSEVIGLNVPYLCDTATEGGGWIVIQRRTTGNVDFYRDWVTYKKGFGSLMDDFWFGNENIHTLTSTGKYELRIEMIFQGKFVFAHYDMFSIENEANLFNLTIGKYDGTAGDSLIYHNGSAFSTYDKDNGAKLC